MSTRLEHVLRVGAQHAAHRTAPTAGFGDNEPIPREVMGRALQLLDRNELYRYMHRGLRELQSLSDAELYSLLWTLPRDVIRQMQDRIDSYFPISDSTVAVSHLLGRLWGGLYDERGVPIPWAHDVQVVGPGSAAEAATLFEILLGHPAPASWIARYEALEEPERSEVIAILRRQVARNDPVPRLAEAARAEAQEAEAARAAVQEAYDDLGPTALQNL